MRRKLPKVFRNFYFLTGMLFLIWMIFLDSNNLIARYSLTSKRASLEREKGYYEEKIKEVELDREGLFGNQPSLEKFAREKYLMKKESEDVFIVVEE